MNPSDTPPVVVETGPQPDACVIWLHGLGADGHDFEPLVPELRLPPECPMRFVFPHAPVRPVTLNGGMAMRAWYDFLSLDLGRAENTGQLGESVAALGTLIEAERARGINSERILIAGFSQGGVIALHTALRHPQRLAGVVALSTYLPDAEGLGEALSEANRDLPVFMAHGEQDPIIPIAAGRAAAERLRAWGYATETHEYPMPHSVCVEEIEALRVWLLARLGAGEC
jgi:phospholipase/carboxylesterase